MHRISFGAQLAWMMAAQEAVILEFEKIKVEHMMLALLKVCDLDESEIKSAVKVEGDQWLTFCTERNALKAAFTALNLSTSEARRSLRTLVGGGGHAYAGGTVHRDEKLVELFKRAEELRKDSADIEITLLHIGAATSFSNSSPNPESTPRSWRAPSCQRRRK